MNGLKVKQQMRLKYGQAGGQKEGVEEGAHTGRRGVQGQHNGHCGEDSAKHSAVP